MLSSALRENVDLEVGASDLLGVLALLLLSVVLASALEVLELLGERFLLLLQATLDDFRTCKQTFLERAECLILDCDGGLLLKVRMILQIELLENRLQEVVLSLLVGIFLRLLLLLLHLVPRLHLHRFLQDLAEEVLGLGRGTLRVDGLLKVGMLTGLTLSHTLVVFDLLKALALHLVDLFLSLLQLSFL